MIRMNPKYRTSIRVDSRDSRVGSRELSVPEQSGRISRHYGVARDIMGNNAARPDDGASSDGDAGQNDRASADPDIIAYHNVPFLRNGLVMYGDVLGGSVSRGNQAHKLRDGDVVADVNGSAPGPQIVVLPNVAMAADPDIGVGFHGFRAFIAGQEDGSMFDRTVLADGQFTPRIAQDNGGTVNAFCSGEGILAIAQGIFLAKTPNEITGESHVEHDVLLFL